MKILITGGAGFIGSAVVHQAIAGGAHVVNVDALTYSGDLANVAAIADDPRYAFEHADICDAPTLARIFSEHDPDAVMHLAAESHVDRSIDGPAAFVRTNVVGTCVLLEAARAHWGVLSEERRERFRFHHVSTDEVYGALGETGSFTEETPYAPNSPYSASKAGSDHLVRAWAETYGLPIVVTNCSNNYGPRQFPEKLVPVAILNALAERPIPVYGAGRNVRDWLYVEDHAEALLQVLREGEVGETYNIGGDSEARNIDIVQFICAIVDEFEPRSAPRSQLIEFVPDRPGHDFRYAIDASKISRELGWRPSVTLEEGLRRTVSWYIDNEEWWRGIQRRQTVGTRIGLGR